MSKRLTKEEFVEKAIKKHGDWYDYSKVVYVDTKTKVLIICPIHGEFWQTPDNHLNGRGCPHCGKIKKTKSQTKSQEQLIKEFREVHGDWYDYSKVEYINNYTKVLIICPDHGGFWQTPVNHLRGQGCPFCHGGVPLNKEIFVERSIEKHGEWYDYSKVLYVDAKTKVCIICPIHGEFWQTPDKHLSGQGCPLCKIDKIKKSKTKTQEQVIKGFKEVHGDWYDYSKVGYINANTKVLIICPDHGGFWQTPDSHLSGHGCPYCRASKLENSVAKILTNNNINFIQNYKGFDWLKNINKLELDFYLPEHNMAIECQGVQHFESIEYWGGDNKLEYIQNNDKLKLDLCNKHNLRLFYINYNDNIEDKIDNILKNIITDEIIKKFLSPFKSYLEQRYYINGLKNYDKSVLHHTLD
jgi:hypothetical protein